MRVWLMPSPMLLVAEAEKAAAGYLMWVLVTLLLVAMLVPLIVHLALRRGTARQRLEAQRDRERMREEIDAWRESARRMVTGPTDGIEGATEAFDEDPGHHEDDRDFDSDDDDDDDDHPSDPHDRGDPRT